jgi:hypothetical protein
VLGFDSARSTDHEWGPRLVIFLAENEREAVGPSKTKFSRPAFQLNFEAIPPTSRSPMRIGSES